MIIQKKSQNLENGKFTSFHVTNNMPNDAKKLLLLLLLLLFLSSDRLVKLSDSHLKQQHFTLSTTLKICRVELSTELFPAFC